MFAGFKVAAGKDRFGKHIKIGGQQNDRKVSGKDTGGAMCIFEFAGGGWPRHLHNEQDEWLYVLEGEFDVRVGDEQFRLGPGGSVFLPRKVGHVWACVSGGPGKVLNLYQPAGKMEEFFREFAKPSRDVITAEQIAN